MATQVQFRRGSDSEHNSFTGVEGEITVNTTNKSIHVHDGSTVGGTEVARADLSNINNVGVITATEYYGTFKGTIDSGISLDSAD
jgi:predicted secreted protein